MSSCNQGGMTGLNLSGESGKHRLTLQGVKVQQLNSRSIGYRRLEARATAVVLPPSSRARSADRKAGTLAFPYPYVEALGACWPCAEAIVKGGSKPL